MSLIIRFSILVIILSSLSIAFLNSPRPAHAVIQSHVTPENVDENTATVTLTFTGLNPNKTYDILDRVQRFDHDDFKNITGYSDYTTKAVCGQSDRRLKTDCNTNFNNGDWFVWGTYKYTIREADCNCNEKRFTFDVGRTGPNKPVFSPNNPRSGDIIKVTLSGSKRASSVGYRNDYEVTIVDRLTGDQVGDTEEVTIPPGGSITAEFTDGLGEGNYNILIDDKDDDFLYYTITFSVEDDADGGSVSEPEGRSPDGGFKGIDVTNLLPERTQRVVNYLITFGIGIAGGIAFLLLVYGSLKLVFSAGDPKAVGEGREVITSAIIGLLVIIFSVFLLRLIGLSVLGLPI